MKPRKTKKHALARVVTAPSAPARWAVTQDGAFLDLSAPGGDEISGARAHALVEFVRKLDKAAA